MAFGTPLALNNKIAQRPTDRGLTVFYAFYAAAVGLATALLIVAVDGLGLDSWLWPNQRSVFVWAAAAWALAVWINQVVGGVADAYGHTVDTERTRMWQSLAAAALILVLYAGGWLTLSTVFIYHYIVLGSLTLAWLIVLRRARHPVLEYWSMGWPEIRRFAVEFYDYSHPLVIYTGFAFVTNVGERWLLQTFGGSVEQGFFGLASQISAISFMFTGAMTPVLSREFSVAARRLDTEEMGRLFRRHIPLLYAVATTLCAFIATESDRIVVLLGGDQFATAAWPMAIMAFYPAHQTYGQLCGSVFYATGQTRLYRNIGITAMTAGMIMAYVLIAPTAFGGLDGGAVGLAAKTILMQILAVNLQLFYSCRLLKLRFDKYAAHQVVAFVVPLSLALLARGAVSPFSAHPLVIVFAAGVIYALLVLATVTALPQMFGLSRGQLAETMATIGTMLKGRDR